MLNHSLFQWLFFLFTILLYPQIEESRVVGLILGFIWNFWVSWWSALPHCFWVCGSLVARSVMVVVGVCLFKSMARSVKVVVSVCLMKWWIGSYVCLFESVAICLFELVLNWCWIGGGLVFGWWLCLVISICWFFFFFLVVSALVGCVWWWGGGDCCLVGVFGGGGCYLAGHVWLWLICMGDKDRLER